MDKVVVFGSPGAGKTTFARKLGHHLKIKVIHLDRHFWEPRWIEKPRDVRELIQHDLLYRNRWIIEGTYLDSSDERLRAADTIIFLDVPRMLCLWRVIIRRIKYHKQARRDLPKGCTERLRFRYILKVLVFPHRGRKTFFEKIKEIESNQLHMDKQRAFYWLKSNQELEDFFQGKAVPQIVQTTSIQNRQRSALSPKVALAITFLSYLGLGVGTMKLSLPFAILTPSILLKHLIQRHHSNKVR